MYEKNYDGVSLQMFPTRKLADFTVQSLPVSKTFLPAMGAKNKNKNRPKICLEVMFALPSAMLPPFFRLQILRDALEGWNTAQTLLESVH